MLQSTRLNDLLIPGIVELGMADDYVADRLVWEPGRLLRIGNAGVAGGDGAFEGRELADESFEEGRLAAADRAEHQGEGSPLDVPPGDVDDRLGVVAPGKLPLHRGDRVFAKGGVAVLSQLVELVLVVARPAIQDGSFGRRSFALLSGEDAMFPGIPGDPPIISFFGIEIGLNSLKGRHGTSDCRKRDDDVGKGLVQQHKQRE